MEDKKSKNKPRSKYGWGGLAFTICLFFCWPVALLIAIGYIFLGDD